MAGKNKNLTKAKKAKCDEFYTILSDIEKECKHYRDYFRGKVIYCNCDDARESNFFKYFSMNFDFFGLKKLITTSYNKNGKGSVLVYEGDKNGNRCVDDDEIKISELKGDGDFRSEECIEFLKEADIVVTNPPFSLFREYVKQLIDFGKQFLIIGNMNAITYKEIFPYIKDNKMWLGMTGFSTDMVFAVPEGAKVAESDRAKAAKMGYVGNYTRMGNSCWFTNLPNERRNKELTLFAKYNPTDYPKYDNYDAIEVSKTAFIPKDYDGVMGVPISFLDKYCPTQFEIVGTTDRGGDGIIDYLKNPNWKSLWDSAFVNNTKVYKRIFIRKLSCE